MKELEDTKEKSANSKKKLADRNKIVERLTFYIVISFIVASSINLFTDVQEMFCIYLRSYIALSIENLLNSQLSVMYAQLQKLYKGIV